MPLKWIRNQELFQCFTVDRFNDDKVVQYFGFVEFSFLMLQKRLPSHIYIKINENKL